MKQNKKGYWKNKDGEVLITEMPSNHINNAINKAKHDGYGNHERVKELRKELKRRTLIPTSNIITVSDALFMKMKSIKEQLETEKENLKSLLSLKEKSEARILTLSIELKDFNTLISKVGNVVLIKSKESRQLELNIEESKKAPTPPKAYDYFNHYLELSSIRLDSLNFKGVVANSFRKAHIYSLGKSLLYSEEELLAMNGFGSRALTYFNKYLKTKGLTIGMFEPYVKEINNRLRTEKR